MSLECEHGQLARSCNLCEYEREIAELRARVGELEAENQRLGEALSEIATGNRTAHEAMLWARQALRERNDRP